MRFAGSARSKKAPRGVLVLGMHRSGTSAATGLIHMLGLATCVPGDMVRGPWNPNGHFESRSLMHLDNALLAQMGRRWWYPPPAGDGYGAVAESITTTPAEARRVFRRAYRRAPWVWKDPRACVLLPFWRRALGDRVATVVVFRHPVEVAESLQRRHDLPVSFGLALWERYNRLVLQHAASMPVLTTSYDALVGDPARWAGDVRRYLEAVGMRLPDPPGAGDLTGFVDAGLRHSSHERGSLDGAPPGAAAVYEALLGLRGDATTFVPPDLPAEAPSVEAELATVGPGREPGWRPPPWATGA
ncbi:MAG TPA: hypothetical protein VKU86_03000 [Acidimicrobiales bacterium]|nr:hypothetical protein [Acidimicrobiales bacterium]